MTTDELIERLRSGAKLRFYQSFERSLGFHEGYTIDDQELDTAMVREVLRILPVTHQQIMSAQITVIRAHSVERPKPRRGRPPKESEPVMGWDYDN